MGPLLATGAILAFPIPATPATLAAPVGIGAVAEGLPSPLLDEAVEGGAHPLEARVANEALQHRSEAPSRLRSTSATFWQNEPKSWGTALARAAK